jgi:hypothetical protein
MKKIKTGVRMLNPISGTTIGKEIVGHE